MTEFQRAIYAVVKQIPKGKTLTYKEVAQQAGRPKAFRAVGNILNKNYDPSIPCHRVVRSDGKTGGYNRGKEEKVRKLKEERAVHGVLHGVQDGEGPSISHLE
jgi:methylated-DNA-[protein]-cysteine S-methyltransferase